MEGNMTKTQDFENVFTKCRRIALLAAEVDIRKFFDTLDHRHLREFLRQRVRDGVVAEVWYKWLCRRKRKPYPNWAWFERLLRRYPLPPAIPVHSVCRAAKA